MDMDNADIHPFYQEDRIKEQLELGLNTPLHLCEGNSDSACELIKCNASLLAQNMSLEAAWERHTDHLSSWLSGDHLKLEETVVAVCKAKNLPVDCSLYITEYYVSLFLAEHFERAMTQELSKPYWPWMALSLTHRVDNERKESDHEEEVASSWSIHREAIKKEISGSSRWNYRYNDDGEYVKVEEEEEEQPVATMEFMKQGLEKVKMETYKKLFEAITSELYSMQLFTDVDEHDAMEETAEEEDNEGGDNEDENSLLPEKKRTRV